MLMLRRGERVGSGHPSAAEKDVSRQWDGEVRGEQRPKGFQSKGLALHGVTAWHFTRCDVRLSRNKEIGERKVQTDSKEGERLSHLHT